MSRTCDRCGQPLRRLTTVVSVCADRECDTAFYVDSDTAEPIGRLPTRASVYRDLAFDAANRGQ